jgi:hypothetical protein
MCPAEWDDMALDMSPFRRDLYSGKMPQNMAFGVIPVSKLHCSQCVSIICEANP